MHRQPKRSGKRPSDARSGGREEDHHQVHAAAEEAEYLSEDSDEDSDEEEVAGNGLSTAYRPSEQPLMYMGGKVLTYVWLRHKAAEGDASCPYSPPSDEVSLGATVASHKPTRPNSARHTRIISPHPATTIRILKASAEAELYIGMIVKDEGIEAVPGAPLMPSLVFLRAAANLQKYRDQPSSLPPPDSHRDAASPTPPWLELGDHSVEMVPSLMVR